MASARFASLFVAALVACFFVGCAPPLTTAMPCVRNGDCEEPLACVEGRCASECAEQRDCTGGTRCVIVAEAVGRCFVDAADQCDPGPCPYTDLICSMDRCYNACAAGCPGGSLCVEGLCTRPSPDAGTLDAGTP